ncbi:MAG TPA: VOC family protein [Candidatus Saccharimonadales bacterium]|nr:VOC family protein [Candidatus Saccharimonadales bacterium]
MTATPTIGVKDLETATGFYGGVLGLKVVEENPYVILYKSGDGMVQVYKTDLAGTNKATYVTWTVDDIDAEVAELKGKGVTFEQYDMPGVTRQGDVHIMENEKSAWFKDPDGNILCIHQTV